MAVYAKPIITNSATRGLIPALILSPVPFVSPAAPIIAGVAALAALSKKGDNRIDSTHTSALTARKNFSLA